MSLLVQVFSPVCEGALIAKLAAAFLPILAEFCFLLLFIRGFVWLVVIRRFSYSCLLFRRWELLSTFAFRVVYSLLCGAGRWLECWRKAVERVHSRRVRETEAMRSKLICLVRLNRGLRRLTVRLFVVAVFER